MKTILRPAIKGVLTLIPGVRRLLPAGAGGGTHSASYCYGVWLKHLTLLWENGMRSIPNTLAELGPGDSLGVGLSAMLSGVDHYYALDVVRFSNVHANLEVFDELVTLFRSRAARPTKGWPDFDAHLNSSLFPDHILSDDQLDKTLCADRVAAIRNILSNPHQHNEQLSIRYMAPWSDDSVIKNESVDVILSHSVLEHVTDLENTYRALYEWLKPSGRMTHQIDFTSHGLSEKWNGYWAYSELLWRIVLGKRPYLINRQPHSVHLDLIRRNGFSLICDATMHRTDGIRRSDLSSYWQRIADDDLSCSGAFIQVVK